MTVNIEEFVLSMVDLKKTPQGIFGSDQCVHSENAPYYKTNAAMSHDSLDIGRVLKVEIIFRNNTSSPKGSSRNLFKWYCWLCLWLPFDIF